MPVKPENRARYPKDWPEIVERMRQRTMAMNDGLDCCEGSPDFPDCRAVNGERHPDTGSHVVLTTAHLDHHPENCSPGNLRRWCQRCHLFYDRFHHAQTRYHTRRANAHTPDLFDSGPGNLLPAVHPAPAGPFAEPDARARKSHPTPP